MARTPGETPGRATLEKPTPAAKAAAEAADFQLIRRFLDGGEEAAFRTLVARHWPMVRRLLAGLLRGMREEIEDAEQEVLLALFRQLGRFRGQSSFRTYLYSLARYKALDALRRGQRRKRRLELLRRQPAAESPDPERELLESERTARLAAAFGRLQPEDRQIVLMRDVEGFSMEEMSKVLGLPVGTVKSRLHRSRERLARILGVI